MSTSRRAGAPLECERMEGICKPKAEQHMSQGPIWTISIGTLPIWTISIGTLDVIGEPFCAMAIDAKSRLIISSGVFVDPAEIVAIWTRPTHVQDARTKFASIGASSSLRRWSRNGARATTSLSCGHSFNHWRLISGERAARARPRHLAATRTPRRKLSTLPAPTLRPHGRTCCRSGRSPISKRGATSTTGLRRSMPCGSAASGCRRRSRIP
jgi:hypothetical protein